jgi:hypothetical protein
LGKHFKKPKHNFKKHISDQRDKRIGKKSSSDCDNS